MGQYIPRHVEKVVARGVEFLDRKFGAAHWPALIDLKTFDISEGSHCVLGQVVGEDGVDSGYEKATDHWVGFLNGYVRDMAFEDAWKNNLYGGTKPIPSPQAFGFEAVSSWDAEDHGLPTIEYDQLQAAWQRIVRKRQRWLADMPKLEV